MTISRKRFLGMAAASMAAPLAMAQSPAWPNRPVRLVVPFPAGSGTDLAARVVGQHLSASLGQSFVVDNRPGAGGSIGAMEVVRAVPNGYTLFFGSSSAMAANVALLKTMPYDPAKDLTPVGGVADSVTALVVRSNFPARNLAEFVEAARKRSGKLNASYGSSSTQIALAAFSQVTQLEVTAVPYRGTPLAVQDLLAGVVDFTFADLGTVMSHVRAGALRGLGITTPRRSALVDWPPIADQFPSYDDITGWIALAGPPALPREITATISKALGQALQDAEVKERLAASGLAPMPMGPDQLKSFIVTEMAKWTRLAKAANVEPA